MSELNSLLNEIEKLRLDLVAIADNQTAEILDPEVLVASKMLHAAVGKYHQIILRKISPRTEPLH